MGVHVIRRVFYSPNLLLNRGDHTIGLDFFGRRSPISADSETTLRFSSYLVVFPNTSVYAIQVVENEIDHLN